MITSDEMKEMQSVNNFDTAILSAEDVIVGIVSHDVRRLTHYSAGDNEVIVRIGRDDGHDVLWGDDHMLAQPLEIGDIPYYDGSVCLLGSKFFHHLGQGTI
jgi:hypothetical protein